MNPSFKTRVLSVDDEPVLLELFQLTVEAMVFTPLTAVHVANVLEHQSENPEARTETPGLDGHYLDQLGLGSRVEAWREKLA